MHWYPKKPDGFPELTPPITRDEERWWAKEKIKLYKSVLLGFGLPSFVVFTIAAAIVRPEQMLWLVPRFIGLTAASALILGRMTENRMRKIEVRWKRIRESLLAESVDDQP